MQIQVRVRNGALVVRPTGEMTPPAAAELYREIDKELAPQPRDVLLDLSKVDSMATGALPWVFRIQQRAGEQQHRMVIVEASEPVRRLFDATRVTDRVRVAVSEDDALAQVTS